MALENFSFEKAMSELEAIVRALEEGKLSLEESLKAFEQGIKLVNLCNGKLSEAEQKVKILLSSDGTSIEEKDFSLPENK
jgi:exodeoxyribonuclease VII small subunit